MRDLLILDLQHLVYGPLEYRELLVGCGVSYASSIGPSVDAAPVVGLSVGISSVEFEAEEVSVDGLSVSGSVEGPAVLGAGVVSTFGHFTFFGQSQA